MVLWLCKWIVFKMRGCSSVGKLSKIITIAWIFLLPQSVHSRFQMSARDQNVVTSLKKDVLLPCTFRTPGDFLYTEFIIVTWTHNSKEIARYKAGDVLNTSKAVLFESELQRGNASLLLKNFQVGDKGEYVCHIFDPPEEDHITIKINGMEFPKVVIVPDILVRGKKQVISCIADGHYPDEISITWKKNGVPLRKTEMKDDGTFITTESLILNPVDENDEFTCEVKLKGLNEAINTTKKFKLTGNSLSLAGIGNIILSIILILILILISLYIWYHRGKKLRKKAKREKSKQTEENGEIQTLNGV
ncbi:tapasin-related protein-like [Erpetoichthys calabaricus]|uniref:tapasin-related protein-like n=1 Tax=Erpetoichthys calabaricus TaxID=27687 RepID=UPI0022346235|nr:tapasin-related protein-like [Erpetoichthys calabaricus]